MAKSICVNDEIYEEVVTLSGELKSRLKRPVSLGKVIRIAVKTTQKVLERGEGENAAMP